jgi:hypothetical protein
MAKGVTRRGFLKGTALAAGGALVGGPILLGTGSTAKAAGDSFYYFVNNTKGKFSDDKVFFSFDMGKSWTPLSKTKETPAQHGGRIYFSLGAPSMQTKNGAYADFVEYNHNGKTWWGNTTLVDEFIIPFTIELFNDKGESQKVGIVEPRTKLFEQFQKETAKEFHSCVVGTDRIVSPCRADFGRGKANENYFAKYIDEVWEQYATKKVENGWTKEVIGTALSLTPPAGSKEKKEVCTAKPKSTDAFLGEGVIRESAPFSGAINRHVLGEPEFWKDPTKFYLKDPCNHYAKFWHAHSLDHKCYGFSYDDAFDQSTLIHYDNSAAKLVVTINWD